MRLENFAFFFQAGSDMGWILVCFPLFFLFVFLNWCFCLWFFFIPHLWPSSSLTFWLPLSLVSPYPLVPLQPWGMGKCGGEAPGSRFHLFAFLDPRVMQERRVVPQPPSTEEEWGSLGLSSAPSPLPSTHPYSLPFSLPPGLGHFWVGQWVPTQLTLRM